MYRIISRRAIGTEYVMKEWAPIYGAYRDEGKGKRENSSGALPGGLIALHFSSEPFNLKFWAPVTPLRRSRNNKLLVATQKVYRVYRKGT